MQEHVRNLPLRIDSGETFDTDSTLVLPGKHHNTELHTGGKFTIPEHFGKVASSEHLGPVLIDRFFIRTDGDELWPIYARIHNPTNTKTILLRDPVINVLGKENDDVCFKPDAEMFHIRTNAALDNKEMNLVFETMEDGGELEPDETCAVANINLDDANKTSNRWRCEIEDIPLFMFRSTHPVAEQIAQFLKTDCGGVYDSFAYDPFTRLCLDQVYLTPSSLKKYQSCKRIPKEVHLPPIPFDIDPKKITSKIVLDPVLQNLVVWVSNLQYYEAIFKYTLPMGEADGEFKICWSSKRFPDQVIMGNPEIRLEEILAPWEGKVKVVWIAKTRNEELFLLLDMVDGKQVAWHIDLVLATLLSKSVVRF